MVPQMYIADIEKNYLRFTICIPMKLNKFCKLLLLIFSNFTT
jgi:hypothetical protein